MKLFGFFSFLLYSNGLLAKGQPTEWQLGFQEAGSPLMQKLIDFHDFVFWIITAITVFVFLLLAYVCVKFSAKNNKKPSTTTHNSLLEVAWTLVPVLILVVIAIPSFRLLYNQNDFSNIDMTIKATGYTWYWSYEYPDHDGIAFDSIMLQDDELEEGQPRLLSTDYQLVVPVNKNIPGRLNETYFNVKEPGMYYGQCSELCGIGHGFMPISIRAVTENDFAAWVITAKEEFASNINDKYAIK
jgi:cytochrome c oxidase subunit 2